MVRREGIAVLAALLICIGCNKAVEQRAKIARSEPQVQATVVTIQTTVQPSNRTFVHQVVVANDRARDMSDTDSWRLIDLKDNTVTFVDDIAKTFRTVPIRAIAAQRLTAGRAPLPDHIPTVQFTSTATKRTILGVSASQFVVNVGAYQREIWFGDHPLIPPNLFAVLYASEPMPSRLTPMMRAVDLAMIGMHGVPLIDHAELPYGKTKMVIDHTVVKIDQHNVPQAWLNVNPAYQEIKEPAAGPPPASSRPSNQKTPGAGSRSSATDRKTP